ncbi:type I polyketide synthase, partial [Haematococcus lacustris]
SVAAGRISFTFGWQGPAMSVDTACSSALVATHTALTSLTAQHIRYAATGGANLLLHPDTTAMFQRMGALSPDGRCKAGDAAASGYVRAEACGVLILGPALQPHSTTAHGPQALAFVAGSAVNQDGRSSSLTAPNGLAQQAVMLAALAAAGACTGDVGLLQLHGTGTPLGDP